MQQAAEKALFVSIAKMKAAYVLVRHADYFCKHFCQLKKNVHTAVFQNLNIALNQQILQ